MVVFTGSNSLFKNIYTIQFVFKEIIQQSSGGGGHSGIAPNTKYSALNAFKSSSLHFNDVVAVDRAPSVVVCTLEESCWDISNIDGVLSFRLDPKGCDGVDSIVKGFVVVVGLDTNGPDVCMLKLGNIETD